MKNLFANPNIQINPDYEYSTGRLYQECSTCDWNDKNLRKEITHCPVCKNLVSEDCILVFGGTTVSFISRKGKFEIESKCIGESAIYESDFNDTMVFMLRHARIWK